ncbi:hypothetical protein B0O99DRAFT_693150 [Bisporella sp. PMI_857]|nr:hypothetical protein B0O99DRAFT_693150 [Bisporella sp. PMI_857]
MADFWNDFSNNLATDIAPIITLFGEQPTKQFLSESTFGWDALTVALFPLGILTIVVSAIRVSDVGILKSFIGRAQEAQGTAEVELCSSTSDSVCELWGGRGVTRIFGRPKILEFVCQSRQDVAEDYFYPSLGSKDQGKANIPPCGIYNTEAFLSNSTRWSNSESNGKSSQSQSEKLRSFAPKPNLSLNIGIANRSPYWSCFAATFGLVLVASWVGFSSWVTFIQEFENEDGPIPHRHVFFSLLIVGSTVNSIGIGLCAYLINRTTREREFKRNAETSHNFQTSEYMFWLQPGAQTVGDQVFDAFAYSTPLTTYITSFQDEERISHRILLWLGVAFSVCGWILQFICLRNLHAFVSIYLLAATVLMAVLRAFLRAGRLVQSKNQLMGHRVVEGYELDWQALKIEELAEKAQDASNQQNPSGQHGSTPYSVCDEYHRHGPYCRSEYSTIEGGNFVCTGPSFQGFHLTAFTKSEDDNYESPPDHGDKYPLVECAKRVISTITGGPNTATRVLRYRSRLAQLASESPFPSERWDSNARKVAQKLQQAIELTADFILSRRLKLWVGDKEKWLGSEILVWTLSCRVVNETSSLLKDSCPDPICFSLRRVNGRWRTDLNDLEAVIGLWTWSINAIQDEAKPNNINLSPVQSLDVAVKDPQRSVFSIKTSEIESEVKHILGLWLPPTVIIQDGQDSAPELGEVVNQTISNEKNLGLKWVIDPRDYTHLYSAGDDHTTANRRITLPFVTTDVLHQRAQYIFTAFLRQMSSIMDPLYTVELIEQREENFNLLFRGFERPPRDFGPPAIRLSNPEVESLVGIFIECGLGERDDAFSTIIPVLLACSKLPSLEQADDQVILKATSLERQHGAEDAANLISRWSLTVPKWAMDTPRGLRIARSWAGTWRRAPKRQSRYYEELGIQVRRMYDPEPPPDKCSQTMESARDVIASNFLVLSYPGDYNQGFPPGDKYPFALQGNATQFEGILKWACELDCPEIIEDTRLIRSEDLIVLAAEARTTAVVQAMLQREQFKQKEFDFFLNAVKSGKVEVVKLLLRQPTIRENLSHKPNAYQDPATDIFEHITAELFELILECYSNPVSIKINHRTMLSIAAQKGCLEAVNALLRLKSVNPNDVNPNNSDKYFERPLHWAVQEKQLEVVKALLGHNEIDPDMLDKSSRTPLLLATENRWLEGMRELLKHVRTTPDKSNTSGRTPLLQATEMRWLEGMKELLSHRSVDPNAKNEHGKSPLSCARDMEWDEGTQELLMHNQNVDEGDDDDVEDEDAESEYARLSD